MATWSEFATAAPEIAEPGEQRLFQLGPGLAFLATVRADGGPRLHPVCVNIVEGGLYLLIVRSPKRGDLLRDGRFALHSFPAPKNLDEFYLTGRAHQRSDPDLVARIDAAQRERGAITVGDETAFELDIERALYSNYGASGKSDVWPPKYLKWSAS